MTGESGVCEQGAKISNEIFTIKDQKQPFGPGLS